MDIRFADLLVGFVAGCALVLVLCGTGHAEMLSPDLPLCTVFDGGPPREVPCEEAWLKRADAEPPCLAQMEDAMRAMEPFLNDSLVTLTPKGIERKAEANKLWADARQDCWKNRQP